MGLAKIPWRQSLKFALLLSISIVFLFSCFVVFRGYQLASLENPEPSLLVLDKDQQFIAEISNNPEQGVGYWPLEIWPERVANALLVLEDQRFWQHSGVDGFAVARALFQNIKNGRRISGASTITMQVARMQNPNPRTYFHKLIEASTALWLTARYQRREILTHYLRLVPYGNNIHGIAYASERYFNKPASDLSWAEIALLSAIPQSPTHNNPLKVSGRKRAQARAVKSLQELLDSDLISLAQYQLALQQLPKLTFPRPKSRPPHALHVIAKLKALLNHKPLGQRRIVTSLSLSLQADITAKANRLLQDWRIKGADNVAAIVINNNTMEVICWLGSSNYFSEDAGAMDYAQTWRSPGSTFKPFIFGLALDRGFIKSTSLLPDLKSVSLGIGNSDHQFLGPMLPRQALANSRNVPAINLVRKMGLKESLYYLEQLQLTQTKYEATYYGAGIAIGTAPSTLENLVRAYAMLANDGQLRQLRWYDQQQTKPAKQHLSEDVSRQITLFLSDPSARLPSFPRMGTTEFPFPVAIKTGTSQGYRDAWALSYNKDYTVGVWVGRSDANPMYKLNGAVSAAQLNKDIFLQLYKNVSTRDHYQSFPPPQKHQLVSLCGFTGRKANNHCQHKVAEWIKSTKVFNDEDVFKTMTIDTRNGFIAGQWTPSQYTQDKTFLDLPPIYSDWMQASGWQASPKVYSALNHSDPRFFAAAINNSTELSNDENGYQIKLSIISPQNNVRVSKIPSLPDKLNTLPFYLNINRGKHFEKVKQVLWYVDDKPVQVTQAPFTFRWPLLPGSHKVFAELPYFGIRTKAITVHVI